jgi:ABC-2 type transport system ATP-binding protein
MIEVRGITKRFGGVLAVDDLSFDVRPGRVTGFLGPNGSGKSTTMRCMLGLDHAERGTATFGGRSYRELPAPLHEVGCLLDAGYVHPGRTGRDHLRWLAASNRIPKSRIDEVLEQVGLSDVAGRRLRGYSLGMRQRLGLAGVLLGDPATVILDEPANGLDPEGIRWIRDVLVHLAREGRTVFVSSHVLSEMTLMAEDLVVIGRGRLVEACSVDEFIARHTTRWVQVRSPQLDALIALLHQADAKVRRLPADPTVAQVFGVPVERVGELAAAGGIVLHELVVGHESLEDAFLAATAAEQEYRAAGLAPLMPDVPPTAGGRVR